MDLTSGEPNSRDFSSVFKIVNFGVGALSILFGVIQLLSTFQSFILGLYVIAGGAGIIILEIRSHQELYNYASFLFSFLGRGIFYILIAAIISHPGSLRVIPGFIIGLVGVAYSVLHFIPNILPPENMKSDFAALHNNDDDGDVI